MLEKGWKKKRQSTPGGEAPFTSGVSISLRLTKHCHGLKMLMYLDV